MLVVEHQAYVFNLAFRVLGNEQEAEDTAQEAFVRAWQSLPRFRAQARFGTWMYRIVTNLCYNRLPKLRRELSAIGEDEIEDHVDLQIRSTRATDWKPPNAGPGSTGRSRRFRRPTGCWSRCGTSATCRTKKSHPSPVCRWAPSRRVYSALKSGFARRSRRYEETRQ